MSTRTPKPISDQLREAIENAPMTRYVISKETGISQGQLSRFVRGEVGLNLDTVDLLGQYLGLEFRRTRRRRN